MYGGVIMAVIDGGLAQVEIYSIFSGYMGLEHL